MPEVASGETVDPADIAWRGIELCRRGDWQEGLYWLGQAAEEGETCAELPGLLFAYLGFGIAEYQGKREQGLQLCRRAVEMEFYQPESYYFLARAHLLLNDRRSAVDVVDRGLQIDATSDDLKRLKLQLGQRKAPVFRFLPRGHFINRWLGRLRHRLLHGPPRDHRPRDHRPQDHSPRDREH